MWHLLASHIEAWDVDPPRIGPEGHGSSTLPTGPSDLIDVDGAGCERPSRLKWLAARGFGPCALRLMAMCWRATAGVASEFGNSLLALAKACSWPLVSIFSTIAAW
jgi:hypothetical protein